MKRMIQSFKLKIVGAFFIFVLLILSVFSMVLYNEFKEELTLEMQESMQDRLGNISYNMEVMFETIKPRVTMLALNDYVVYLTQRPQSTATYDYFSKTWEVKNLLQDVLYAHEILESVYLVSVEEEFFLRTNMSYTYDYQMLCREEWFKEIQGIQKNTYLRLSGDTLTENVPEDMLSYVVPVRSIVGGRIVGYLCANVGYSTLEEYFYNNKIGEFGEFLIYDKEKIIYSTDENDTYMHTIMEEIGFGNYHGQKVLDDYLISYEWSETMDWMYIAKIPMSEVIQPTENIKWLPWLLGICSIPIIALFAVFFSSMIFFPINTLIHNMRLVGKGKYALIEHRRQDEFGAVFDDFNRMTEQIFSLMDRLCTQETLAKELEIKNLQAQLSPHFLYNTLDAIHWAAREKDMGAVSQMTFLLSKYFRKNLSNGKDWVTVQDVSEMIKSYMDIQSLRFMDGFSYVLKVDPEISVEIVPKNLFQPIVENALYHGIERSSQKGFCSISWESVDGKICFRVKDNGKGMSKDKLEMVMRRISDEYNPSNENFALRNIQKQLRLYYGEKIYIVSEPERGTEVYFFLAKNQEEEIV